MARDARTVLTRPDHHGEQVTYRFKDGSPDRVVRAVVDRLDSEPAASGTREVATLRAVVAIPRDPTVGVESVEPGDQVVLAMRLGGPAAAARVARIQSQDEGLFLLEVEL